MKKSSAVKVMKYVFLILVLIYIGKYFYRNINDLKNISFKFNILIFGAALVLFWIYKLYNALLWHYITVKNNCSIGHEKAVISWIYSLLGKYIPGKVFYLGGRLYFYHNEGVSKKKVTFCFLLENICTLLAALFLFLLSMLFIDSAIISQYKYVSLALMILFLILINPSFMQKGLNIVLKALKKAPASLSITYKSMLFIVLHFVCNWIVLGLGFYLLVNSITRVPVTYFFYTSGSFALANFIGIVSLFAPSGIGVREAIIVLTLKAIIPEPVAVVVSIAARVWATVGELLIVFFAFLYDKIRGVYKSGGTPNPAPSPQD